MRHLAAEDLKKATRPSEGPLREVTVGCIDAGHGAERDAALDGLGHYRGEEAIGLLCARAPRIWTESITHRPLPRP